MGNQWAGAPVQTARSLAPTALCQYRLAKRRLGFEPRALSDEIEVAKALLANPDIGVTEIAHRLGVSQATLDASLVPAPAVTAMEAKRNAIKSGSLKVPVEDRQPT